MVSIVVPESSLTDLINAGLTVRYYHKKDVDTEVHFVNVKNRDQFWNDIGRYIDEKDRSLLILNFPLPSEEILKKIKLRPYEYSILNIPSELIAVTPQSKKILLEKGIVSMPQRATYKCFPGEYTDKVERRWVRLSKLISFEREIGSINEKRVRILKGLLKIMGEDPHLAIQKIESDDVDFLCGAGTEEIPISKHLEKRDLEVVFTQCKGFDLFKAAFYHFLHCRKTPLGIKGEHESIILTEAPTFARYIFQKCNLTTKDEIRSGKGAAISTSILDETDIGILVGRLSQRNVTIEFSGKPKYVVLRTLKRRLIGEKGSGGRSYRGIKEKYPELEFMKRYTGEVRKNIIYTPRYAFENVVDTLKETGTEFKIMA